ncbi:type I restriction enzyme S subunit [Acidovorax delafieldii]|uniref:Type I restriction enzyme S subunit n=2 Tax=Acidovorax delafieldii TaxID=47920 RepID=A0A561XCC6_ACIDE|nr:type I restriction enzyme S subunit [Acidovorax delafieldii]
MCEAVVDCPHSTPVWTDTGFVVLRNQNIKDGRLDLSAPSYTDEEHFKQRVRRMAPRPGDIVITREAPMGEVCKIPEGLTCCLGQRQVLLRPKAGVNADYLLYALQSPVVQEQIRWNEGTGSTVSNIRIPVLEKIEIPRLGASEQFIAAALKSVDDKIDINRRINQTLEAMAQAIFKSWFVDFDPVKAKIAAKAEGRDPQRAAMTAISGKADAELDALPPQQYEQLAATAALFPDEMEESELGEIPMGWIAGNLGDICNFTAGSAFSPEHQGSAEGDYPFIKVSDMNLVGNEVFIQSANNYVSQARQLEMKAKLHPQGATVFAKIGVALISNRRRLLITPTIIDNNMMSASPIEGKSASYFLYSMLSTIDFNTLVSGTALPYLNVSDLRKIPIVRPLDDVCRAFELKAAPIFLMMQKLAAQSVTLASVRGALLPKLLSGEIEVSGLDEG